MNLKTWDKPHKMNKGDEHMEDYEVEMLAKIDSDKDLTENDLKNLIFEYEEVDKEEGENRRWVRAITSIIKIGERFFSLAWEQGLTECQENEFYYQPVEVKADTYEKTIVVTKWVSIDQKKGR